MSDRQIHLSGSLLLIVFKKLLTLQKKRDSQFIEEFASKIINKYFEAYMKVVDAQPNYFLGDINLKLYYDYLKEKYIREKLEAELKT